MRKLLLHPLPKLLFSLFILNIPSHLNAQTFNTEGVHDIEITSGTSITIDADGAHGGNRTFTNNPGGSGGDITATFNVNTGDFIRVIVGQPGVGATNDGGGGGGTAVINCGNSLTNCDNNVGTLLVVAGAGGGAGIISNGGGAITTAGSGGNGSNGAQGNSSASQASCNVYTGVGSHPGDGYGYGGAGSSGNGGGGAGYTGGDGVAGQNGADGGSNFIDASATSSTNNPGSIGGGTGAAGIVVISGVSTNIISSETCSESIIDTETFNSEGVYDLKIASGTSITIDADGAHGGNRTFTNNPGGSGGDITATFNVNTGDFIRVIVGQAGVGATNDGGGGGGTAIINCGNSLSNCDNDTGTLLVVAGAGGGAGINSNGGGAVTNAGDGSDGSNGAQGNSSATQASCNVYTGVGSQPGDGYGYGGAGSSGNGGGGAGYTGGDGVAGQNGADGGSNYIDASATSSTNNPGSSGGGNGSDGSVSITSMVINVISSQTCAQSIAPVELIYFNAVLNSRAVELQWSTASEVNNYGFELEWAVPNMNSEVREWETIGFVSGNGTSFQKETYSFNHSSPDRGMNYYRLKQIDFDGSFEYSSVVGINNFQNLEKLQIAPNPIRNGQFSLGLPYYDFDEGRLSIYNAQGQNIQTQRLTNANTLISTSNLPKGIYAVIVELDGNRLSERILVQ